MGQWKEKSLGTEKVTHFSYLVDTDYTFFLDNSANTGTHHWVHHRRSQVMSPRSHTRTSGSLGNHQWVRLYLWRSHRLHWRPVIPTWQGRCPVDLSHSREPFTVPVLSQLQDRPRKELFCCRLKYPSKHWLHCLPPTWGLQWHCPVRVSQTVSGRDPAGLQSQALQLVMSSP